MKFFVTGANGFLGRHVVAEALDHGHDVVAMVRDAGSLRRTPWHDHERVEVVVGDLRRAAPSWVEALGGADVVVHLAAAVGGDFATQFASTVLGTEQLLATMADTGVLRLVHVSTFSVYDYRALAPGSVLDESSPLEANPTDRDEYAQTKLVQERLVRGFAADRGGRVTVVRPGAVYGPNNLWNAGRAVRLAGPLWAALAPNGELKLTYVENCAQAIVLAAERDEAVGETLNIVDDDPPTQREYEAALKRAGFTVGLSLPVPYVAAKGAGEAVAWVSRRRYGGKLRLPAYAVPAKMDSQYRPLHYPNARAKAVLGWTPRYRLDEALARIKQAEAADAGSNGPTAVS